MPEIDIALHGAILIEEKFKMNYDEEPEVQENREVTAESLAEEQALKQYLAEEEYTNAERQSAYKDLTYINRYAQNCPVTSQMKMLMPERLGYKGPDPPPEDWKVGEAEPMPADAAPAGKPPVKGKPVVDAAPVEVQKSPECEAADKSVRRFMK